MGKTGKWIRNLLTGKKDKVKEKDKDGSTTVSSVNPRTPIAVTPSTPKEKRRWSFRRSPATGTPTKDSTNSVDSTPITPSPVVQAVSESENEQKKYDMAMLAASSAAADAAMIAAQATAEVIRLTTTANEKQSAVEDAAAIRIQSYFRSYLALVTVQARARAQRIRMAEEVEPTNHRPSNHRRSPQDNRFGHTYDVRILQLCAAPSALTDMSPRTCSGHFEESSFATAQSSPQYYSAVSKPDPSRVPFAFPRPETSHDYPFFPNYMANTQSFKAKVRSQSAPKQRPDSYERQPSRRKSSIEGRNVPRAVRMQRSSSHVGSAVQGNQYPWSVKLDRSMVSLKDSECGSTSTVLTNTTYCRSVASPNF